MPEDFPLQFYYNTEFQNNQNHLKKVILKECASEGISARSDSRPRRLTQSQQGNSAPFKSQSNIWKKTVYKTVFFHMREKWDVIQTWFWENISVAQSASTIPLLKKVNAISSF
ncbi:MAG: hypothetical protein A3A98_03205 [Candidatus Staskawiczbacteria bacterium RIFCSPLOWO2_01_FULL_40_39]|uniref:Uncharacterized protein n=1 Tax=Candidatus Staskawiczbacteria bacterium RIFCSPHIGHO2_01_FULL_39_25 TaxID=1802202 RepID=A0A1G2HQM5_9BACT|nr:MAG: hypothetical protein A2730_02485 [Candidatus Staskawiczbacteria bacterium RIFCSPHIGHO2_01_FULL_39_25]OGZ72824.1 MAG: hypothetical protein A3A98_03205 [Candidatus Staskawiczbacteria bacterium RIFCSPLOWO2_01_FULL_40_39]